MHRPYLLSDPNSNFPRRRPTREITFDHSPAGLKIGRFPAFDYFGDGGFYLLDAPAVSLPLSNPLFHQNLTKIITPPARNRTHVRPRPHHRHPFNLHLHGRRHMPPHGRTAPKPLPPPLSSQDGIHDILPSRPLPLSLPLGLRDRAVLHPRSKRERGEPGVC